MGSDGSNPGRAALEKAYGRLISMVRRHLDPVSLAQHVMPDPGIPGYVAALGRVLDEGTSAIESTFDITENIGWGVNWCDAKSEEFRWFRVLTSTIALYLAEEDDTVVPHHQALAILVVDCLALDPTNQRGLRAEVCALARALLPTLEAPCDQAFCILAELRLSGDSADEESAARASWLVDELERIEADTRESGRLENGQWIENPWFTGSAEFLWGLAEACGYRSSDTELLPVWLDLIHAWSPVHPRLQALRERLIREGQGWSTKRRRLS